MKNKLYIFIMLIICLSISGCKTVGNKKDDSVELALNKLKDKYGEDFVYAYADPGNISYNNRYTFYVKTENANSPVYNKEIKVVVENFLRDDKIIFDRYISAKYEDDVKKLLKDIVGGYFVETKIYYDANKAIGNDNINFNKGTTLKEHLLDDGIMKYVTLEVLQGDNLEVELLNQLSEELFENFQYLQMVILQSSDAYFATAPSEHELRNIACNPSYETSCDSSKSVYYAMINKSFDDYSVNFYK